MAPHLLLGAAGVATAARAWVVSLRPPAGARPGGAPDVDGLAYLAGGPRRVVEVAVARLVRTGALEVAPGARVRVRGAAPVAAGRSPGAAPAPPVASRGGTTPDVHVAGPDRAVRAPRDTVLVPSVPSVSSVPPPVPSVPSATPVLDRRVRHHAGRESAVDRLLTAYADDPEVHAARTRLAAAGLVGDAAASGVRRRARRTLTAFAQVAGAAGALVFLGLLVGIARTGVSPLVFGVLGVAVVVTAGLGMLAWAVDARPAPRFRTSAGWRALAAARRGPTRGHEWRVALDGLGAEVPLGWRAGWWRARHVLRRLVPAAALALVAAGTAEVLAVVARLS